MKAEDLMIGDWVNAIGMIGKVECLNNFPNTIEVDKVGYKEGVVNPILLTPEILEKNKFTIQDELYHSGNIWISEDRQVVIDDSEEYINTLGKYYSVHIDNDRMDSVLKCEVTYVHELQHAFRLAGYDKEFIV